MMSFYQSISRLVYHYNSLVIRSFALQYAVEVSPRMLIQAARRGADLGTRLGNTDLANRYAILVQQSLQRGIFRHRRSQARTRANPLLALSNRRIHGDGLLCGKRMARS